MFFSVYHLEVHFLLQLVSCLFNIANLILEPNLSSKDINLNIIFTIKLRNVEAKDFYLFHLDSLLKFHSVISMIILNSLTKKRKFVPGKTQSFFEETITFYVR